MKQLKWLDDCFELPFAHLKDAQTGKNQIKKLVDELNLGEFENKKTGELSSGQKNRVSLAKSLINSPQILLLE